MRLGLACYLATAALWGAQVSGVWTAEDRHGGDPETITMDLKVEGDGTTVTGTVTGRRGEADITDGRIDDDEVSFSVVSEYNGASITQRYTGTLEDDVIHFSLRVEGGRSGRVSVRELDATRVS